MNYQREWRLRNPSRVRQYYKKYDQTRKRDPEKNRVRMRKTNLKLNYGLTLDAYKKLLHKQNNQCAICRTPNPHNVDHCHSTKKVRGILCNDCNLLLGYAKDDLERLTRASIYLMRSGTQKDSKQEYPEGTRAGDSTESPEQLSLSALL